MATDEREIVKIEWTETTTYSAYVYLPEGVEFADFDQDDYMLEDDLAEINEDRNFEGMVRENVEVYNQKPPPGWRNGIDEIDWTPRY